MDVVMAIWDYIAGDYNIIFLERLFASQITEGFRKGAHSYCSSVGAYSCKAVRNAGMDVPESSINTVRFGGFGVLETGSQDSPASISYLA